ncbi:NlpC/P60 family protein [Streptomyces sp. NPDC001941]|uniref:C40 family peptidase n=1 Tax=Streptomyces sp. NPDC001941 TaxID=3154659 RepID=UPI0033226355
MLRTVCTAALVAVTTVAAVPAAAEPVPDPAATAGTDPWATAGTDPAAALPDPAAAVGTAPSAAAPDPAAALETPLPEPTTVPEMLTALRTLFQEAEEATEAYNAAAQELKKQTAQTHKANGQLNRARTALERSRGAVGRLAREQYQGRTEFSSVLRVLLAHDPQSAMDQRHLMDRESRERLAALARLERGEKRADQLASTSRKALDRTQNLAAKERVRRDAVQQRLRRVEQLLASLSTQELSQVAALERKDTARAQDQLLSSGVLDGVRNPSQEGGAALRYALEQVGKPYVWGAEGPQAYDCSGLTSRAWQRAGRAIPRTSQEQWATLPHVPLRSLRPGDLVVYYPKATHVAMYLGDGMVVQAPRPGSRVKVSPIAANPLLGAVRPDPTAGPLSSYRAPALPTLPRTAPGDDAGFDAV